MLGVPGNHQLPGLPALNVRYHAVELEKVRMRTALIAGAAVAVLAGSGCGSGSPAPAHSPHAAATHAAAMSVARACRYLDAWQARYGLNDNAKGREALRYVSARAHNRIGQDAGKMLADYNAGKYTSPNAADPDESRWVNDCVSLTGTP